MARKSPSEQVFVLTIPLKCESWQRDQLDTLFAVCNRIKNTLIAYEKKQYQHLMRSHLWKENQAVLAAAYQSKDAKSIKDCLEKRNQMLSDAGFSVYQFEKQANRYRKHFVGKGGKGYLVNTHISQKIAASVWKAFESLLFKNGKEVSFSKWTEFVSIFGKSNASGIRYRNGMVFLNQMKIPAMLDQKDPYGYQEEALSRTIHYCGITRKWYCNGWKYFVQLVLSGLPPVKSYQDTGELLHPMGTGRVGHDIGPQTIASVGKQQVILAELANQCHGLDASLWKIQRAMDRSRRKTNPQMFQANGMIVPLSQLPQMCKTSKGRRKWVKSKRYLQLEAERRELFRKQKELRLQQHKELANYLLSFGNEHYIETMRFRALAKRAKETKKTNAGKFAKKKRFGKSISNKAPAAFVQILKEKVIRFGGTFQEINTFTAKASQYNHLTDTYSKKSLSKRWNIMPDGTKVQRDLYSAFLIQNIDTTLQQIDAERCKKAYDSFLKLHDAEIKRIEQQKISFPSSMGIHQSA